MVMAATMMAMIVTTGMEMIMKEMAMVMAQVQSILPVTTDKMEISTMISVHVFLMINANSLAMHLN